MYIIIIYIDARNINIFTQRCKAQIILINLATQDHCEKCVTIVKLMRI